MKLLKILGFLLALAVYQKAQAQTATVTWTTTYQTIDGFGAGNVFEQSEESATNSYDSFFFGTGSGSLGLSILRMTSNSGGACTSVSSSCGSDGSGTYSSPLDAQACAAISDCRVIVTSFAPPAQYSTTGSTICSPGNGTLNSADYQLFATYLSNYVASLKTYYGVTVYAITPQNEPTYCPSTYAGSLWSGSTFDTFIKSYLGPTIATNNAGTKIFLPDASEWATYSGSVSTCMGDSSCSGYVSATSFHDYDLSSSVANSYSVPLWMTEYNHNGSGAWTPTIADALTVAQRIHTLLIDGVSLYAWWNLVSNAADGAPNGGLVNPSESQPIAARAYAIGQWAKFVRPGWIRVDATANPANQVSVSAFKETASGNFAIVAVNQNSSPVNVAFSLAGFPSVTSATPTITSASSNLEDQAIVDISNNAFSYSLPGMSVTTFHGTAALSSASKLPTSPTNLTANVN